MRINGGVIYADYSSNIYFTDDNDSRTNLIYSGRSTISTLYANSDLIYFVEGSSLYRMHIQSGLIDTILENTKIDFVFPNTNHEII